jgi:hypothetical protein
VAVVARIPEGRILEDIRTEIAVPAFELPRPLDHPLVLVSVSITPVCRDRAGLISGTSFLLESTSACAAPAAVDAAPNRQNVQVRWEAAPGDTEVFRYSARDGRLLSSTRTAGSRYDAEIVAEDVQVLAIRNRCGQKTSDGVFLIY